jgi:murein DD-endopeptidase MepM/ murein hydrolase activator NlpD
MAVARGPDHLTDPYSGFLGPKGPDHLSGTYEGATDPIVETSTEESSADGTLIDVDISGKEFRYNPPMHAANLAVRADYGQDSDTRGFYGIGNVYDESGSPRNYTEDWAGKNLQDLRLGRIVQHTLAPGHTSLMKYRWGFRFLYNPTQFALATARNSSFIIDGRSEANRAISGVSQNYQTIEMSLLLDRVPDVMAEELRSDDYSPRLRKNDEDALRKYGTHWDLEALFKVCNGEWNLTDRGKTSNIGILIPSNSRLIVGKADNLYGFVGNVTYQDILFSKDMVPIRTEVNLTFRRHLDMTTDQVEDFTGFGSVDSGESARGETLDDPFTHNGSVGNNKNAPVPGYNKVTTGFYGYRNHNGWDYGTGGIANKPVHATHSGKVTAVKHLTTSYGKHVIIESGNLKMIYAHMRYINTRLRVGQTISAGDWIGRVGTTGNSTGNHLHYEERLNGKARMPIFANNTGKVR